MRLGEYLSKMRGSTRSSLPSVSNSEVAWSWIKSLLPGRTPEPKWRCVSSHEVWIQADIEDMILFALELIRQ